MNRYTVNLRNPKHLNLENKPALFYTLHFEAETKVGALIQAYNFCRKTPSFRHINRRNTVFEVVEESQVEVKQ